MGRRLDWLWVFVLARRPATKGLTIKMKLYDAGIMNG